MKIKYVIMLGAAISIFATSCGGESKPSFADELAGNSGDNKEEASVNNNDANNIGIGPIKENVTLGDVDNALADKGKTLFEANCAACHKLDKKFIGPALKGVVDRRNPAWIMNMILNPEVMVNEDPIAKQLLAEYISPMANQNLSEEEARAILEYFRTL